MPSGDFVVVYAGARLAGGSRVEGFTQLWPGVRLEQGASPGPGVTFERGADGAPADIVVGAGARIGAGATVRCGVTIGGGAVVEAGTLVAQSVPPYAIVSGVPARITGYVEKSPGSGARLWHNQAEFPERQAVVPLGVGDVTLHRTKLVRDPRGDLSVGEFPRDIPFDVKRYFLVFNVPSEKTRGEHAHHKCHQFLLCVKGSCAVVVDDGHDRCEVLLESPDMGIHLPPLTWGIQYKYSSDAVLLVFTSHYYEAEDYIRDYAEFVDIVRGKQAQ
ncbi:WxcM-like domain-containing protein [Massilia sp. Se16.2.3]|uniref:WxcM-like domain-containing protein n=1 Tax=Massilia sp. Se16.2.3 TaxID=2709303 RepID=UPI001E58CD90|nr:WxcM-like domain-containing protein [Massilia sp. Se16.2.3]